MSSGYINLPSQGSPTWKSPVATAANLPASGNTTGDARVAQDTAVIYIWSGSAWVLYSGSGITALTGDVTATGPGSAATTLATVNSNIGQFTKVTVNGKGLVTAATTLIASDIPNLAATYVTQTEVGAASGVASLDVSGKIPVTQLPSVVMEFQGVWDPSTNTPTLADGVGTNGYIYRVSTAYAGTVAGLTDPSMGPFYVGDLIIYAGASSKWQRSPSADGVTSVNSAVGAVTVNAINQLTGDVTAGPASGSASAVSSLVATSNSTLTTLTALSLPASQLTGQVSLAHGGTASTTGSITGSGALTFAAGGSNQNVTLTPSGTGFTILNGNVGIGISSPTSLLHTVDSAAKTTTYTGVLHSVTNTSSTASVNKIGMDIESTGAWNGTSATNTGLVVNATGGTTNYAAIFMGGNVGIGITTPVQPLDVTGNARIQGTVFVNSLSRGSSNFTLTISADNTANNGPQVNLNGSTATNPGTITLWSGITSSTAERVRIDAAGNVGIGTASPNANAILDVTSTTKAFMPPRMTTTQKNAVASPTAGMVVYDSTLNKLAVYTGSAWETVTSV